MNNLVDSSAWIEYFRGNPKYLLMNDLIHYNAISVNDIILAELLPSILHRKEHTLAKLLESVKSFKLTIDWPEIRGMQLLNLKYGNNNIGISDLIIAQNCIQNGLKLISNDKHFGTMSTYLKLEVFGTHYGK